MRLQAASARGHKLRHRAGRRRRPTAGSAPASRRHAAAAAADLLLHPADQLGHQGAVLHTSMRVCHAGGQHRHLALRQPQPAALQGCRQLGHLQGRRRGM